MSSITSSSVSIASGTLNKTPPINIKVPHLRIYAICYFPHTSADISVCDYDRYKFETYLCDVPSSHRYRISRTVLYIGDVLPLNLNSPLHLAPLVLSPHSFFDDRSSLLLLLLLTQFPALRKAASRRLCGNISHHEHQQQQYDPAASCESGAVVL